MPFDLLVQALITIFIVLAMLCVGLAVEESDITSAVRDRRKMGRALLANIIIAPIVAIILVNLIPMPDAAAKILLLLGFAPGGINAVQFSTKSPGYLASAAGLLLVLSAAAIFITPIAAGIILEPDSSTSIPYERIALRAALFIILPLAAGMAIRRSAPSVAEKLFKPAMLMSTLAFIASVLTSMALRQDALGELGKGTMLAMLAFILIMMFVGWRLGGPERGHRQVLAVTTNLRNVGLVYVIVAACCTDPMLPTAVFAFMALMVPPNLILTIYNGIWRKKHGE